MRRLVSTRAARAISVLFALSLMLTACDPNELMRLVSERLVDQPAAAPDAADDSARSDGATRDEDDAAAAGKTEEREFQCRRGGSPRKKPAADADDGRDADTTDDASTADDAPADTAADDVADQPKRRRPARPKPAPAEDAPEAPADEPANDAGDGGGPSADVSAIEEQVFDTLNATRRQAGLKPLSLRSDISDGARAWSCDMARTGNFRHADLRAAGVNGENIAWGYPSAAAVHEGWMNSAGHRRNRMSASWTEYGIGVCEDDAGRRYYTERFR